jgi:hypothetical protein
MSSKKKSISKPIIISNQQLDKAMLIGCLFSLDFTFQNSNFFLLDLILINLGLYQKKNPFM